MLRVIRSFPLAYGLKGNTNEVVSFIDNRTRLEQKVPNVFFCDWTGARFIFLRSYPPKTLTQWHRCCWVRISLLLFLFSSCGMRTFMKHLFTNLIRIRCALTAGVLGAITSFWTKWTLGYNISTTSWWYWLLGPRYTIRYKSNPFFTYWYALTCPSLTARLIGSARRYMHTLRLLAPHWMHKPRCFLPQQCKMNTIKFWKHRTGPWRGRGTDGRADCFEGFSSTNKPVDQHIRTLQYPSKLQSDMPSFPPLNETLYPAKKRTQNVMAHFCWLCFQRRDRATHPIEADASMARYRYRPSTLPVRPDIPCLCTHSSQTAENRKKFQYS